ncbi:methylisocitrate lyase, partial [bacterium]
LEAAMERAKRYVDAGADAIFPEGLSSEEEFEAFRAALPGVPLLANMTEFGKTPLIPFSRFNELGYQMVIFPMTGFRLMLRALDEGYAELLASGTQAGLIDRMRTREELYERIGYAEYDAAEGRWAE